MYDKGATERSKTITSGTGISATRIPSSEFGPGAPDLSGQVLGGYQLVRLIAEGGMGVVYEAIQLNLSRNVAVKILSEQLAARPEFVQRFQREAKAAAALNHPNMVQVHDFCQADGRCCLVMEFVAGQDLDQYADEHGKLSVEQALPIAEQAALALKAAHEKSIIHRDIKPSNLMISSDGHVKVSDLGLAKILTEASDLTVTGVGMGSPYFMAPEQASDAREVDHRADIYSLGLTLLFLLTGKRPFDGNTPFSIVLAHANKPLPSGVELGTELPGDVEALIQKMAAKNPEDRYLDYDALLQDLRRVKAGNAPAFDFRLATRKYLNRTVLAGVGAASLVAVATFVFAHSRQHTPAHPTSVPASAPVQANDGPGPARRPPLERERPGGRDELAERPPPDDFGGPDGGRLPEPPQHDSGKGIRSPLGRLPRPNASALHDGPASEMLAEADAYAAAHPRDFRDMVDRYRQVMTKARGTPEDRLADQRLQTVIENHQQALRKTMQEFESKMNAKLQAGQPQAAYDVWRDFPQNLRTFESDQQISEILQRHLPAGFVPKLE